MRTKKVILVLALSAVGFLIACMSCNKNPKGPKQTLDAGAPSIYLSGFVVTPTPWDSTGHAYVRVSKALEVSTVTINGIHIPLLKAGGDSTEWKFQHEDFPILAGDSAKLVITCTSLDGNHGTAQANIVMPGKFEITSHDTSGFVTFPVDTGLTVTWSSSDGATIYRIRLLLKFNFQDDWGNYLGYTCYIDTFVTDTSASFPSSGLLPEILSERDPRVLACHGSFQIFAKSHPCQEGGGVNLTDDSTGYFYGKSFGGYFRISTRGSHWPF